MAKSIRSKSKRKNRTEFRNTIGSDAAKANMDTVQSKLQECINSTQMNSFDRLSNLFAGSNNNTNGEEGDGDVVMNTAGAGKDSSKIPAKKSKSSKLTGQYGDKTSFKVGEKRFRRDRTSAGSNRERNSRGGSRTGGRLRSSSKKRGGRGKKLATI